MTCLVAYAGVAVGRGEREDVHVLEPLLVEDAAHQAAVLAEAAGAVGGRQQQGGLGWIELVVLEKLEKRA
jgi:hypothetical protein